jgi:hypothetical protein
VREVGVILDTGALLAYASGPSAVGEYLVEVADRGQVALIPATCLACAYGDAHNDGPELLDLIANLEHGVVSPLERTPSLR